MTKMLHELIKLAKECLEFCKLFNVEPNIMMNWKINKDIKKGE